jgi:hypothetical protein
MAASISSTLRARYTANASSSLPHSRSASFIASLSFLQLMGVNSCCSSLQIQYRFTSSSHTRRHCFCHSFQMRCGREGGGEGCVKHTQKSGTRGNGNPPSGPRHARFSACWRAADARCAARPFSQSCRARARAKDGLSPRWRAPAPPTSRFSPAAPARAGSQGRQSQSRASQRKLGQSQTLARACAARALRGAQGHPRTAAREARACCPFRGAGVEART